MAAAVELEGGKEFRKALKDADSGLPRQLTAVQRVLAQWLAPQAQAAARSEGGSTAHFASRIQGRGTQRGARLEIPREANAAFWGAYKRTGWNQGHGGRPQHPEWVGASWDVGGPGGPYALNPTVRAALPEIEDRFGDGIEELLSRAFPGGT